MSDPRPTTRFSDRVEHYVRHRPGYPADVLDYLQCEIELTPAWTIADVGSGTGISAELFLRHGNTVYGVEPNGPMRAAAERYLAGYPQFHSVEGTAEATTLPDQAFEAVVAGQAFHWFDAERARDEFKRILRPDGWVVLLWNARRLEATPFLREYEALLLKHGTDYQRVRHERVDAATLDAFFGAGRYIAHTVENLQPVTLAGLRGRLLSSSYVPSAGQPGYDEMLAANERLFAKHQRAGEVCIEYDTQIFCGRLA